MMNASSKTTGHAAMSCKDATIRKGGSFTELHGNEKYYKLSQCLTAADEDVREIHKGDVMLFDGQYVAVFYQDFQTTYRYTRLGHVEAADDLDAALGAGDVFLTLQP